MIMMIEVKCAWTDARIWLLFITVTLVIVEVTALSGPNVCMVKQKYNITKKIKYRAPMSVRTYKWCFSVPPRCSIWTTEMRDLTRLETEERTAEVAVCCPGYKMKDVSCVPICPNGKTGPGCSEDCKANRWGPNCVHECRECSGHGVCSPVTGECECQTGWQGESCKSLITTTTTSTTPVPVLLTSSKATTKTTVISTTVTTLITTPRSTAAESVTTASLEIQSTYLPTTLKAQTTTLLPTYTTKNFNNDTIPATLPTEASKIQVPLFKNVTISSRPTAAHGNEKPVFIYNITETPLESQESTYNTKFIPTTTETTTITSTLSQPELKKIRILTATTESPKATVALSTKEPTTAKPKVESTKKPEPSIKMHSTTLKFKPKEIWIRPAQKGESTITETKIKNNQDTAHVKHKTATKIEIVQNTTPKTIIVSIIPTSVSYATFKKIALTTASYMSQKNSTNVKSYSKIADTVTKPMFIQTSTMPPTTTTELVLNTKLSSNIFTTTAPVKNITKPTAQTTTAKTRWGAVKSMFVNNKTNSMSRTTNAVMQKQNISISLTTVTAPSTNITSHSHKRNIATERSKPIPIKPSASPQNTTTTTLRPITLAPVNKTTEVTTIKNITTKPNQPINKATKVKSTFTEIIKKSVTKKNATKLSNSTNTITTDKPAEDEETFHILTEPEHITAVMTEKGTERSSVDLISVISIAGGIMMAVITVAVIIVMIERCRKPRYEDVRKINDIRMQVMIDNNDVPPPYVRSIFHTPLPDPPTSEKCHYQPISTLDRNLKQFMRPVVVQTISPVMLENFRGILECHYDHLPRRSNDFGTLPARFTVAPSVESCKQHNHQRASMTESTIEALKCEAKLDVIDSTTSEPLYAEIPFWRPPSEHAVEIINMNGEAVTEL